MPDDPKRDALEYALRQYGHTARQNADTRDELVRASVACGISKHRVHVLTGIARTTIDGIIKRAER
jgi:hypothetical protein